MGDLVLAANDTQWRESAGVETLRRMASVDRYNRWIIDRMTQFVGQRVLEVGCGIGNMTPYFLNCEKVCCIDVQPESAASVAATFERHPNVSVTVADISHPASVDLVGKASYDTVVCINVLEHIESDGAALRNMGAALAPGGYLLLLVPAGQYLYGHLDVALGHFRRYSANSLRGILEESGFDLVKISYMNVAGIPGWFLSSRVLRREAPPRALLWLFNFLAPAFIRIEDAIRPGFGQSLVCVARCRER